MKEPLISRYFRHCANAVSAPFSATVPGAPRVAYGSADARALQRNHPAVDLHNDMLMMARFAGYDPTQRHRSWMPCNAGWSHSDLPRMRDGLIGASFFSIVTLPVYGSKGCFRAANEQLDIFDRLTAAHPNLLRAADTGTDVDHAADDGVIAGIPAIEGAHALEGDVDNVAHFARRGVRYIGLAHFSANEACYPATGRGRRDREGLTPFGKLVVEACNEHGVMIDVTHINRPGFADAAEISRLPLIASHTCMFEEHPQRENVRDSQLRLIADSGGVVGMMFQPYYLGGCGIDAVIAHMTHVLHTVGEDHLAIGSDWDGMSMAVPELAEASMLPNLTDAMLRAGWPHERIIKVLRGNALRVLDTTAQLAAKRQRAAAE